MPTSKLDAIEVDAAGFTRFARDLRKADKDLQKLLLAKLKEKVTGAIVPAARSNASFSTRIPQSIRVSATNKGVSIRAGGPRAPHAAAFEDIGGHGTFRHPTFGHREAPGDWVEQRSHPFITPAVKGNEDGLLKATTDALDTWAQEAGFH